MPTKNGVELITEERQRQVDAEGWSAEHDEQHDNKELVNAALSYLMLEGGFDDADIISAVWPWAEKWWKPKNTMRNLVRAGALIAAEIDRLQRLEASDATTT